jgi:hypothetical protein
MVRHCDYGGVNRTVLITPKNPATCENAWYWGPPGPPGGASRARFLELFGIGCCPHGSGAFFSPDFHCTNLVQRVGLNPLPKFSISWKQRPPFIQSSAVGKPAFDPNLMLYPYKKASIARPKPRRRLIGEH